MGAAQKVALIERPPDRHGQKPLLALKQNLMASLTIQENADPSARYDLECWIEQLVPEDNPNFTHTHEGPDDMPAHIKAALTSTTLSIPVYLGELTLGVWQGVYVWEHRHRGSTRQCVVHIKD